MKIEYVNRPPEPKYLKSLAKGTWFVFKSDLTRSRPPLFCAIGRNANCDDWDCFSLEDLEVVAKESYEKVVQVDLTLTVNLMPIR